MPGRKLPAKPCGTVSQRVIPAGTTLWRVHSADRAASAFCPVQSDDLFGGGRFDSTSEDYYTFLYAAFTPETALCETLLQGLSFRGHATRQLQRKVVRRRSLSRLTTTTALTLVSLASTADLTRICQDDDWLIRADGHEYAHTRAWARWLRRQESDAHGMIWLSSRDLPRLSVVLFGDRCPADAVKPDLAEESVRLDDAAGAAYLNSRLGPYGVTISPPR